MDKISASEADDAGSTPAEHTRELKVCKVYKDSNRDYFWRGGGNFIILPFPTGGSGGTPS